MTSTYKTVQEVAEALKVRVPDSELKELDGNKYVSWDYSLRALLDICGPFGFDIEIVSNWQAPELGLYSQTLLLTVRAWDSDLKQVITAKRTGVGRATAMASKAEREAAEKRGETKTVSSNLKVHDTAIAGAASDALSRAVKQLGDAFGAFLYDKNDPARQASTPQYNSYNQAQAPVARQTGNTSVSAAAPSGDVATDAQKGLLSKLKVPAEVSAGLSKRQASDLIKAIKENGVPVAEAIAPYVGAPVVATSKAAASAAAAEVSIDDLFN